MPNCKYCGADILWVKTQRGKNMPIDMEIRSVNGLDPECVVFTSSNIATKVCNLEDPTEEVRTSHFQTCPERQRPEPQPNKETPNATSRF